MYRVIVESDGVEPRDAELKEIEEESGDEQPRGIRGRGWRGPRIEAYPKIYDSLFAKARCPVSRLEREVEILFKWGPHTPEEFKIGSRVATRFDASHAWAQGYYSCLPCSSPREEVKNSRAGNIRIIKPTNPVAHTAYIFLADQTIKEVIDEKEFYERFRRGSKIELPQGVVLYDKK